MSEKPKWIVEAEKVFGLHEVRDNAKLRAWLKSDGPTLGDPKVLPWCGDFVDTAIDLALPNEPRPGKLGENPYWALNWLEFGKKVDPCLYAVAAFVRPGGGHVGFLVGQDASRYYVLGGNQANPVTIVPIDKTRFRGARWPSTVGGSGVPLPRMTSKMAASRNEA
jgi:uncharacterized protein (TIGR02594 family)